MSNSEQLKTKNSDQSSNSDIPCNCEVDERGLWIPTREELVRLKQLGFVIEMPKK